MGFGLQYFAAAADCCMGSDDLQQFAEAGKRHSKCVDTYLQSIMKWDKTISYALRIMGNMGACEKASIKTNSVDVNCEGFMFQTACKLVKNKHNTTRFRMY